MPLDEDQWHNWPMSKKDTSLGPFEQLVAYDFEESFGIIGRECNQCTRHKPGLCRQSKGTQHILGLK